MTMLSNYWPTNQEVDACIKNEAETAAESVLLAVHREVNFLVETSKQQTEKSEQDFLTNFLTPNVPSGALIMPVLGSSGIGKSHVIRWLEANIKRKEDAKNYHIIRIPKTANLRKVVELILEPLKNNVNYAKIRRDLDDAVQNVTEQELIRRFIAELDIQIRAHGQQAQIKFGTVQDREEKVKLRQEIGFSKEIPFLFTDSALEEYFRSKVFNRLTKRSFSGGNNEEDFDELPQFKVSDFEFPETVEISKCAQRVQIYISTNIATSDDRIKIALVDFLNGNQLIDRALKKAYNLSGDFGGKTLEELILDIRDELFKEKKELVLLIEDFAALTGFQDTILNVAIQEGQVDGKQVRATMRTAVAVTDGYQLTDTISTRAKSSWRIQSREFENNEVIFDEMSDMVGAYLNAARWGKDKLDEKYYSSKGADDWVGIFEDEGVDDDAGKTLNAFGRSNNGFPLFPFNRNAIKVLANSYLRDKTGTLVFTPRELINHIIRPTLLARELYENGKFPFTYENVVPKTNIAQLANKVPANEPEKNRVRSALAVWGGNPEENEKITGLNLVFKSFNLVNPVGLDISDIETLTDKPIEKETEKPKEKETEKPTGQGIKGQTDPEDDKFKSWKEELEDWVRGNRLSQITANRLRNWLYEAVERHIQWDIIGIPKTDNKPLLSIAYAEGEGASGEKIIVCDDNTDEDGKLRAAFFALYRYNKNNYSFDYVGGDTDYLDLIDLVERISLDLVKLIGDRQIEEIAVLAQTLQLQARVLGFNPPTLLEPHDTFLEALFSDCSIEEVQQEYDQTWRDLCVSFVQKRGSNKSWREVFKKELLKNIASYQGAIGTTEHSINTKKLITAMRSETSSSQSAKKVTSTELRNYFIDNNDRQVVKVAKALKQKIESDFLKISQKIDDVNDFDKDIFIESMRNLKDNLVKIHCYPTREQGFDLTLNQFEERLSDLVDISILPTVQSLEKISNFDLTDPDTFSLLNELGVLDFTIIEEVVTIFDEADKLCKFGQENISRREEQSASQDLGVMQNEIKSILDRLRSL